LDKAAKLASGEMPVALRNTGEEGVHQIRAILGLTEPLVTNVNIPNRGQIPNLPIGAVVETNAVFRDNSITPVFAGEVPTEIYPLVSRICAEQEMVTKAVANRDVEMIFNAFACDPLVTCTYEDARELFKEMVMNTAKYLTSYDLSSL
jgi:alpha-galactosidase